MRVHAHIALLITCIVFSAMAQFADHRTLYLFTSGPEHDDLYQAVLSDIKENRNEIADRDLRVYTVRQDGGEIMNGKALGAEDAAGLRKQYKVPEGKFTLILVGKDRTEKLRWVNEVNALQQVFDLIDTMPMRRREMREQSADDGKE